MKKNISRFDLINKLKPYFLFIFIQVLILHILKAQTVTTLAGSGSRCSVDGMGILACFNDPSGVAVDALGNVYVGDYSNNKIRKITPSGMVTTLAGSWTNGSVDDTGTSASFNNPSGVAVDASGNVYVADVNNNKIRKITPAGVVTTLAGSGATGYDDGTGALASFYYPNSLAVDASGNIYVGDAVNNEIRKITPTGEVTTFAGLGSSFNYPSGVAVDTSGNVYVADQGNNIIRKITPAGVVTTLAGSGTQGSVDAIGILASFNQPTGVAVDTSGNVYVADYGNNKIRKITSTGVVTTLAGSGNIGSINASGALASFNNPYGVAVDASGNVYVADTHSQKIRKISNIPTAIEDQSTTINLTVFPNPTSGDLLITAPENLQLIIYNAQGIKVTEQTILEGNNTISLENHKAGLYIIQSTNGVSKSQQYKIIKN